MKTFDINTSDQEVDGTPPGQTFRPLRYTATTLDEIRVGVWLLLNTWIGTYRFDTEQGLDVEAIQDPITSDAEAGELVVDVVLSYPGVLRISKGPEVTRSEGGKVISISVSADTVAGPISFVVPVP